MLCSYNALELPFFPSTRGTSPGMPGRQTLEAKEHMIFGVISCYWSPEVPFSQVMLVRMLPELGQGVASLVPFGDFCPPGVEAA